MEEDFTSLCRRMIESVVDYGIYALDRTGHVASWNPGAQRVQGYEAEAIIGRHVSSFYPEAEVQAGRPQRNLELAAREGHMEDEGWRVRSDGSHFWANVSISAMRDEHGELTGFTKVTRDLSERRSVEEALRRSEERFRLLVQSVMDYAILMLDTEGRVTSWNEGAQRIKGYSADEIIGRSFTTFYPQEALAAGFPQYELEVASREGRFEDEGWRVRKDGSRFWANVVITALRSSAGEPIGFVKVTRDLTARRAAEKQAQRLAAEQAAHAEATRRGEELEAALRAAQEARADAERAVAAMTVAYRELDQFAYVASHDLKAPLRGIGNLAQWIQEDLGERIEGETAEHLRMLQGRVNRMNALIEGILAYSRAGRAADPPACVDTGLLVREVVELIAPPPEVQVKLPDDMPTLETERVLLEQVFMNLLGNAVKYGGAARPDVEIRIGWRRIDGGIQFTVSDNGPGIASEYQDRIWGIFQTLARRDQVEGTGIGLSVVKKIVERRGGRISLESAPGQGATFLFTWPSRVSNSSREATA